MYDSFDTVQQLDREQQRSLLIHGDGIERVWAAWSIALSLGGASSAPLRDNLYQEPDPGVRRHLIIILAGLGEHRVLTAFAEHDPDMYVRASACQYLARLCRPSDTSTQAFLRQRLFADSAQIVALDILAVLHRDGVFLTEADFITLLNQPDREIRSTTIETLLRVFDQSSLFPGILESHVTTEADVDLRRQLIQLAITNGGVFRLISLNQQRPDITKYALEELESTNQIVDWGDIRPIQDLNDAYLDSLALSVLNTNIPINLETLDWLLRCLVRAIPYKHISWFTQTNDMRAIARASHLSRRYLTNLALPLSHSSLPPSLQEKVQTGITFLHEELLRLDTSEGPEDYDDDEEWVQEQKAELEQQITALQRLLR